MQKKFVCMRMLALLLMAAVLAALCGCAQQKQAAAPDVQVQEADAALATYTVTLNPAGGMWSDGSTEAKQVTVKEGMPVDFAAYTPALEGNDLQGWYQQDGYPWPGARKVSGDVNLRAKWSATEVEIVYDLVLTINGEKEPMEYENGVYQFTHVSQIYGGYAQRAGKYTIYEEDLKNAIKADDGKVQRVLYHAGSNYIDATGIIYGEFYNDGEFELYYDYVNAGVRTKYCMNTGYWTYTGYTPPFEATPIPVDETGMGYESAHLSWDKSLTGENEEKEQPEETAAEEKASDIMTLPGETVYTADATGSETMKANFCDNGVMAVFITSYGVNVDAKYLWSIGENGAPVMTYNGGQENVLTDNGDDTYGFDDNYGNSYIVDGAALKAAVREPQKIYTANSVNSKTMFVFFYDNHTCTVNFDLTSFGQEGQFYETASGQWRIGEKGLEMVIDGAPVEITGEINEQHPEATRITFPVAENTYSLSPLFYMGKTEAVSQEGEAK